MIESVSQHVTKSLHNLRGHFIRQLSWTLSGIQVMRFVVDHTKIILRLPIRRFGHADLPY